ncbi:pirin family protein [Desulfitobacterium sp. AusDCA]|uniref:pirin family protein n=1 Tax=Desulfitobacterium sp. AusDCA TaxID=3240383 RepID=UPI003DA751B7
MLKKIKGQTVQDGAGVKLNRTIAIPSLDYADPFFLLDEFRSDNKDDYIAGFPMHPHRGIETLTYMVEGSFIHRDSQGNEGSLQAGEVQWMTAGKGILHEEMPAMEDGHLWGYQIWINLPAKLKMVKPKYRHIKSEDIPVVHKDGVDVKIISGAYDKVNGPVQSYYPITYLDVRLQNENGVFTKELQGTNLIYVHSGELSVHSGDEALAAGAGSLVIVEGGSEVQVTGYQAGFLFLAGEPINEPVARYGPFVMNTPEEIRQAFEDYRDGKLA